VSWLRATTGTRILAAALSLAAIVGAYRLFASVSPTTVALTLLLYILVLAARWGLRYAVIASIAASVCFNFFFLPPVGTLTIADTQNWVALFAFLTTAIIGSQLSNRIQIEAHQAKARERELAMLFELSRALLQTDKVRELLEAIPECIASATRATEVALYVDRGAQLFHIPNLSSGDSQALQARAAIYVKESRTFEDAGWTILPVRTGMRPRGVLLIRGIAASAETLESLARLVSIGIDRAEALEEAARSEAAKESERLRMALLDSITHELRTPLTAIKASATALLSSEQVSRENRQEMLTVIDEECDRLNGLIAQAVQMGQLEASGMHMELAPCSMRDLLQRAVQGCSFSLAEHHLEISIPEDCRPVLADTAWIERAIANLLVNAAKYSPTGSTIHVTAVAGENQVALSVADEGPGIDPAERAMLFERFYRGERFRGRVPGTGMGLAICRAVVEAHHGTIKVENQLECGAKFTITLPTV
jgi:two-component system, OmpR family, sensor histidine kinase KdpD